MKRLCTLVGVFAFFSSFSFAQDANIAERQKLMKSQAAILGKELAPIIKGEVPFDPEKVRASLDKLSALSAKVSTLFPSAPDPAEKTRALPAIWKNKEDFDARFRTLREAIITQKEIIKDVPSLKTTLSQIGDICSSCHQRYRASED